MRNILKSPSCSAFAAVAVVAAFASTTPGIAGADANASTASAAGSTGLSQTMGQLAPQPGHTGFTRFPSSDARGGSSSVTRAQSTYSQMKCFGTGVQSGSNTIELTNPTMYAMDYPEQGVIVVDVLLAYDGKQWQDRGVIRAASARAGASRPATNWTDPDGKPVGDGFGFTPGPGTYAVVEHLAWLDKNDKLLREYHQTLVPQGSDASKPYCQLV